MQRARRLLKAVIDTNIFVSASISKSGIPHRILELWRIGAFLLLISSEQRAEVEEVLHRPEIVHKYGLSATEIAALLFLVDTSAIPVLPRRRLPVRIRDPKDEHVLAAALGGKAGYLVTGDEDLLALGDDPRLRGLRIVTPRAFLDLIEVRDLRIER